MSNLSAQFPIANSLTTKLLATNPFEHFAKMQRSEPIAWLEPYQFWMVTGYEDVQNILRDADSFTMEPPRSSHNPMQDTFGPMMLSIDGPDHKRIRDIFIEPFRPKHVRTWYADRIKEISLELIQELKASSNPVNLHHDFSTKLAMFTVVASIGLDDVDSQVFPVWYANFAEAIGNLDKDLDIKNRGTKSFQEFRAVVLDQIEKLRQNPNGSVLSELAQHQDLSDDEIVANTALTFFGGIETTAALISNCIWCFLAYPNQFAKIEKNPDLLDNAIEEVLRWQAPVQSAMRFATKDVVIHGHTVKKNQKIYSMLSAANRDEHVFSEAQDFDIERKNAAKHLSFAYGPHFCFGAGLARMETKIGLEALFKNLNMELVDVEASRPIGHEFRAASELFVEMS